jgi:hypothetical protein
MANTLQTVEDICNYALKLAGFSHRIGSIWEGSEASKAFLDLYSTVRDELLRQFDYAFAERIVGLTLLKSAPKTGYIPPITWSSAYPPLPWLYQYSYPTDCLKVRAVKTTPIQVPNFDPQPIIFSIINDNSYTTPVKCLVCNIPYAVLTYTGQVTNPSAWEPLFISTLAEELARRVGPVLGKVDQNKASAEKLDTEEAMGAVAASTSTRG